MARITADCSPDNSYSITISAAPNSGEPTLDSKVNELVDTFQNKHYVLKSVEKQVIDNREARKVTLLYPKSEAKEKYMDFYITIGDTMLYCILVDGYLTHLEIDSKVINPIIKSIILLK